MLTGDPLSTVLNMMTFAFIGFAIWIVLRKRPPGE
jgi:hypothetical protein